MISKPSKIMEPVEDKAINSLLEIDLKEMEDLNIWEEKKEQRVNPKRRTYSFHKAHPSKSIQNSKFPHDAIEDLSNARYNLDHQLAQLSAEDPENSNPREEQQNSEAMTKSFQFNEGEYWSSKVNWMSESQKQEHSSQPKLNKKLSFGYQASSRKTSRQNFRYDSDDKTRHNEYKTNLIYSLLTHKDIVQYNNSESQSKNSQDLHASIRSKSPLRKLSNKQIKEDSSCKLSNQVQQYMRLTLKRIYLKNRNEEFNSPLQKPKEYERSSMIRELLINLENLKDHQNSNQMLDQLPASVKQNKQQTQLQKPKSKGMEQLVTASKLPQRKLYHHPNNRHVLNLNLQAEKVYNNRSINQWSTKKSQLVQIQ